MWLRGQGADAEGRQQAPGALPLHALALCELALSKLDLQAIGSKFSNFTIAVQHKAADFIW